LLFESRLMRSLNNSVYYENTKLYSVIKPVFLRGPAVIQRSLIIMSEFLQKIIKRAAENIRTIVLPEGNDDRTIAAAAM